MPSPAARRQPTPPPLAAIVGPTASGKTDLSLSLAERLPVEILVADSRQVYRGMDIGTAKPDAATRAAVPHHLLDLVDPDASFTVADWVAPARRLVPEIWDRGRLPLLVGGTGLYVSALVDGYQLGGAAPSPALRRELAAETEQVGLAPLAERLAQLDPAAAARTDLRNPRRVLRALERAIQAGGAVDEPAAEPWPGRLALIGVVRPRGVLVERIEARAAEMFAGGLLDEAARLRGAGYGPELPPLSGHGYREAFRVLAGEWNAERAVAETARRIRQYAKRQMTWFRRDRRIVWLDAGDRPTADLAEQAAELVRRLTA
ncbi:MAG TPA: tRNA (adenosine(37)-N6)-dimethylallyltransferase MiaA [Candidatus Limnocylindria bacterium]|jgi:tRNA dimethylallyltransferase